MKFSSTLFLTNVLILVFFFNFSLNAENYSFLFEGKKYEVVTKKETWKDAASEAVKRGGYLVEINSKAEQDTIWNAIINVAKIPINYTTVMDGGGIAYVWIGANDIAEEGKWFWNGNNDGKGKNFWNGQGTNGKADGKAVDSAYVNWGGFEKNKRAAEPDNFGGNQNVAAIGLEPWPKNIGSFGNAGEWNDINESNQLYYIIEYDETTNVNQNIESRLCLNEYLVREIKPNPFYDNLSINLTCNDFSNLAIYDQFGKEVITHKIFTNDIELDTTHLPPGVYILALKGNSGISTHVLIKN